MRAEARKPKHGCFILEPSQMSLGLGGMREVKWNRQVREERDKTVGTDRDN